jgi:hypothetical protein
MTKSKTVTGMQEFWVILRGPEHSLNFARRAKKELSLAIILSA